MKDIITEVRSRALATIKKHEMLTEGGSVVIGFSGGPDSLCLFDMLLDMKEEYKLNLYPVHINHNLRGDASDGDQKFCEEFSAAQGLTCHVYSFDCEAYAKEKGITTEEAGREFRYDSFIRVAEKAKEEHPESPVVIAVAQNADDQVETVLMRIIRGTGVDGLAGIPYKRSDAPIVRPLLDIYKKEILEYCEGRGLDPRFDHTNEEPLYNRNKVRLELIPKLEEYNPGVKDAILRLANSAAEDREFFDAVSNVIYDNTRVAGSTGGTRRASGEDDGPGQVTLNILALKDEHPSIRRRVIAMALKAAGLTEDVGAVHYDAIDEIIKADNPSAQTDLPNKYSAWRVYDAIKLGKKIETANATPGGADGAAASPAGGAEAPQPFSVRELTMKELDGLDKVPNTYCAFDLDLLKREFGENVTELIEFRGRRPGDVIKTQGGTKKIQDLLVDMKVPKDEREDVMLATIGNQALWVIPASPGIRPRYSSKWKITTETKKIAYIVLLV